MSSPGRRTRGSPAFSVYGMHRVVMILTALATTGAVAYVWQANAHDAPCPTTMRHNGISYAIYEVTEEIQARDQVGVGTERGCGDNSQWSDEVAVNRIAGIDPRTALVTPVAARRLYVAEGVRVHELPSDIANLVSPQP